MDLGEGVVGPQALSFAAGVPAGQAHEMVRTHVEAVVLLDALLPQNGALQAIRELRLDECCKDSAVLVVGPDSARSMYNAMRDYGADDFVPIPFDREELVSSIDKRQFFELLKRKFDLWQES